LPLSGHGGLKPLKLEAKINPSSFKEKKKQTNKSIHALLLEFRVTSFFFLHLKTVLPLPFVLLVTNKKFAVSLSFSSVYTIFSPWCL
jgi:hypothetical protein